MLNGVVNAVERGPGKVFMDQVAATQIPPPRAVHKKLGTEPLNRQLSPTAGG